MEFQEMDAKMTQCFLFSFQIFIKKLLCRYIVFYNAA